MQRAGINVTFTWQRESDGFTPSCKSNFINHEGISLLDCLLTDSGGLPYPETIPWLNEGVKRMTATLNGTSPSGDWGRETWGVAFTITKAKIYSLHDEAYFQTISLACFAKILHEWTAFLQSPPESTGPVVLNFSTDD